MNKTSFAELKMRAKGNLANKYWYCVGVALLATLLINMASTVVSMIGSTCGAFMGIATTGFNLPALENMLDVSAAVTSMTSALIATVFAIPAVLLVTFPVTVGLTRFFINAVNENHKLEDLFFAYKNKLGNVILISFLRELYIFLWSLLFIVPGIIKSFEYSMIDYILAENPAIDRKRAFEISKALTKGNKFRIFLFGLSFIGWILLGVLACGIGVIFLEPYMQAAFVQMYLDFKEKAIERGDVSAQELEYSQI